jgi:uncharacterized protein YbjT (DUF2867 family)
LSVYKPISVIVGLTVQGLICAMEQSVVAVFGASGSTGGHVVKQALEQGFKVRAFVHHRQPEMHRDAEQIAVDFSDVQSLADAMNGVRAVIIVFGQRPPYKDVFCASHTRQIVEAMHKAGVEWLICQTGALIGDYPNNQGRIFKRFGRAFDRKYPAVAADRVEQEEAVKNSGLQWTIVKPPRLTNGAARGQVRWGERVRAGLFSKIGRADLAGLLVQLIADSASSGKAIFAKR